MPQQRFAQCVFAAVTAVMLPAAVSAAQATFAVATNFKEVADFLAQDFTRHSGHEIRLSAGSTGKLYAQIKAGAPFDGFLAADAVRPARLEREGTAVAGSSFTYAIGVLTLWSADTSLVDGAGADVLTTPRVHHVAIANPALAPYGVAAQQTLAALGLDTDVRGKLVVAQNVGEAYAMVATGAAEAGFVALASVLGPRRTHAGSRWDVPARLHEPIRQDAVLLQRGAANVAAVQFLEFLQTPAARDVIRASGYRID